LFLERKRLFKGPGPGTLWARVLLACLILAPAATEAFVGELEAFAAPANSVFLRWSDVTLTETGFRVERSTGENAFVELATTPPDTVAFTDTGLTADTDYTYRITAMSSTSLPGSMVEVKTMPGFSIPVAEPMVEVSSGETVSFQLEGQSATYRVRQSTDLVSWEDVDEPFFLEAGEWYNHVRPSGSLPVFYEAESHTYERPGIIGLSMPFALPPEPAGTVWDVTLFGASPNNINSTNDDAVGIKVAISIAEPGDVIFIPAGTFTIRQTLEIPTGITLRGAGKDATTLVTEALNRAIVIPPEAHDIRIEDFSLTYLGESEEFETGVHVGSSRQGLNSYRILIDGLRIERFAIHGVSLRDCHHVMVQNCEMLNATNLGGGGRGYGIALNYPTNHNNWIRHNTIGPVIRHAILIQYEAHNNLVEHNLSVDNTEDAYDLHGEDEYANELRYNIARNCVKDGFGVGNTGSTHDRSGPNNWIHHNLVEDSRAGVEIYQGSDIVYVDKNILRRNQYGVWLHALGGRHLYIRGNTIEENQIGITVENSRWIWLLDNRIANQTSYGIEIKGGVSDLIEEGTNFEGNASDYGP
jgi:nitrous oxidase accessory protein NosD